MKKAVYFIFFILYLCIVLYSSDAVKAVNGILDLRNTVIKKNSRIKITGEWECFWQQLLEPADLNKKHVITSKEIVTFPALKGLKVSGKIKTDGYATLRLRILLPPGIENFTFYYKATVSSTKVWINDQPFLKTGQVGIEKNNTRPEYGHVFAGGRNNTGKVDKYFRLRILQIIFWAIILDTSISRKIIK